MVATDTRWWSVIHDVLVDEWEWDQNRLAPETPLFAEGAGTWMDWVELTQLVLDRMGKAWPHGFELGKVQTGEDLARMLQRVVGDVS